jgi:diaminopimelate epimerase
MSSQLTKRILFTKASACGNDFLIVDAGAATWSDPELADLTRRLCDRHNGVGADGVEWLFPAADADIAARLFNADGSEAEISGNGTRCVAAELCSRTRKTPLAIRTLAGLKMCTLTSRTGERFEFETDMGAPVVEEVLTVQAGGRAVTGTRVSTGNPHFVILAEEIPHDWREQAAEIGPQTAFPQGTNVEYVKVRGANAIEIRLFERGVGETQSSGTGSCASAVAAIAAKRVTSPVQVVAPGGEQTVRWESHVFLAGPATIICRGEFFI